MTFWSSPASRYLGLIRSEIAPLKLSCFSLERRLSRGRLPFVGR